MSETEVPVDAGDTAALFGRLRSLAVEASTITTVEEVRGRLLLAVLVATGAFAGSFALIDGKDVQVFSASGYRPELLAEFGRFSLDAHIPLADAARTGETIAMADRNGWVERYPHLGPVAEHPGVAVPLSTGAERVGALGLSFATARRFDQTELAFLDAVGAQVAAVIDRVSHVIDGRHLLDRQRAAERVVRASLLPGRIPAVRGWQIAARYQPASGDLGGDFYDFVPLPTGGWAVVVGDVQGRGAEAAIVSALARQVLRDATAAFDSPAAMLDHLNTAMLDGLETEPSATLWEPGLDGSRFITVVAVTLTPSVTSQRSIHLALGGHPRPLLGRAATGCVVELGSPGSLLGLLPAPRFTDTTAEVSPGDTLVLFTDGLIERHHGSEYFDDETVVALMSANLHRSADEIAEVLIGSARDFSGPEHSDDTAVVVLKAR